MKVTVKEYTDYLDEIGMSPKTIHNYGAYVTKFALECRKNGFDILEAKPSDIQQYVGSYKDRPQLSHTVLFALRSYYSYCVDILDILPKNPAANVKATKLEQKESEFHTLEEVKAIFDHCTGHNESRNKLIVILLSITALRCSEVINIDVEDIDFDNQSINIKGKGKKRRKVYLTDDMFDYLLRYMREKDIESGVLFPSQDKTGRISYSTIRKFLDKAAGECGLETHPHKFRHTGATLAYQSTHDIIAVQSLLGHSRITTTQRYTHTTEENRRRVVKNSPLTAII